MHIQSNTPYQVIAQQTQLRDYAKHPLFSFIVDFFSHSKRLVIEIDGGIHEDQMSKDQSRDQFLRSCQYKVLRFTNEQVLYSVDAVRQVIINALY